jgi:primosomal protein N' (replication factor Y)
MNYYLVAPGSGRYHGAKPLTYASDVVLESGSIVTVPLGTVSSLGFVVSAAAKPDFATKLLTPHTAIPPIPMQLLRTWDWMRQYYPGPISSHTQLLLPPAVPKKMPDNTLLAPRANESYFAAHPLTQQQTAAHTQIEPSGTHLIHGDTGSGKTRLYMESVREALAAGRSSIILTPEISLTSQLARNLRRAFGDGVVVIHSQLTVAARRDLWIQVARTSHPLIIVGPRSALFLPLPDVGLIVLDESHEQAYKQESAPWHHASRVAGVLGVQHKARVLLGSATPPLSDYELARSKQRPIIRLTGSAIESDYKTAIELVDMRGNENRSKGNFSRQLMSAIKASLDAHEQSLIFINRRGTARLVLCQQCGWQSTCPRCDIALTYHGDEFQMRCHTCGHQERVPLACPSCNFAEIVMKSVGTKAIVDELQRTFPEARIARFDTDNLTGERFHERYDEVIGDEVDIIVGTQLIAKGLDLPRLTTLGILNADTSLSIPDFSAGERTYQLIHQLVGRVGRGHRPGTAIIQTYNPDHPIIKAAAAKDWASYYAYETRERRQYQFPPYAYLLKASCRRASAKSAEAQASKVANSIEEAKLPVRIDGPAPAFREKVSGKYAWQLVLRSSSRAALLQAAQLLPKDWSYDIDPINLL